MAWLSEHLALRSAADASQQIRPFPVDENETAVKKCRLTRMALSLIGQSAELLMNPLVKNQKLGLLALGILAVGFSGLLLPAALHWNRWILIFVLVRRLIVIPLALSAMGLWFDRPKYAALAGIFLTGALYLAPQFITVAEAARPGSPVATTLCCVDQTGAQLEYITLHIGGTPIKFPKNKYRPRIARIAALPVTDSPELDLSADVTFAAGTSIERQPLATDKKGKALRQLIVFIRPERTLETIPFY